MTQSDQSLSNVSELDSLDQQIVVLLRTDGRMSFTEISKRLSIPEATARYRVQRLLQSGLIQITAWPNPEKLGRPNVLILWLTIDKGQIDAVSEQLASMNEVRFAATLIGRYNLVVDVYYGSHADLIAFFDRFHAIPGILSYESQVVLKLLKAEYKYVLV